MLQCGILPIIPSVSVDGKAIANFKEKVNLFNKYFSSECNSLPNDSKLPEIKHVYYRSKVIIF